LSSTRDALKINIRKRKIGKEKETMFCNVFLFDSLVVEKIRITFISVGRQEKEEERRRRRRNTTETERREEVRNVKQSFQTLSNKSSIIETETSLTTVLQ